MYTLQWRRLIPLLAVTGMGRRFALIETAPVYALECEMADNILKRWTSKWVQEVADSGARLSEIAGMLAQTEAAHTDRTESGPPAAINKITWQRAGRVTEPGRYMFKFGCLIVTADDLAIWRKFPNAAFTLYRTANEAEEEYRLGSFELTGSPQK